MEEIIYPINLDLRTNTHKVLVMKEGDYNSRVIEATITDNGKPFNIENCTVDIKWRKPDGHLVYSESTKINSYTIRVVCTEQMLCLSGISVAEIVITSSDSVVSTLSFNISVNETVASNFEIESSDEFSSLKHIKEHIANNNIHIPEGGTAGQAVVKDENGNVTWGEVSGGSGGDYGDLETQVATNTSDIETLKNINTEFEKNIYDLNYNMMCFNNSANVKTIAHRGYTSAAPENTISAYKAARMHGFQYVETDVQFTQDNIPVLLHDITVDRTSNGTGRIDSMTYAYARTLDFGNGERIPSFEEFIKFCKYTGLSPYIEFKVNAAYTSEQIKTVYDIVKKYGMLKYSTFISFISTYLEAVKTLDDSARLGFLMSETSNEYIRDTYLTTLQSLKTDKNEVFLDVSHSIVSENMVNACMENGFEMEVWTVDDAEEKILSLNPYITGITSNTQHVYRVMCDYYLATSTHEEPVIDLDFANYDGNGIISNIGVFENCDAVVTGVTEQSDGAVIFETMSKAIITSDYINQILQGAEYTIALIVDEYSLSGKMYERIFRCDTDVPSLYYHKQNGGFSFKISDIVPIKENLSYYNPNIVTLNGSRYCSLNNITGNTVFVYTKDATGRHIYINGVLAVSQHLFGATVTSAKDIGVGDTNDAGYNLNSLTMSMFRLYDRALTQAEIANLAN